MRIGIDAREMGRKPTGVGRYLRNILHYWVQDFPNHQYYLYYSDEIEGGDFLNSPVLVKRHIPPGFLSYNIYWQQIQLPSQVKKDRIDVFFSPSYSLPLFLKRKKALTIHDVSFEAHPQWFRPKERFSRLWLTRRSAHKADLIFTVSQFSKSEIMKYYGIAEEKIAVVPNGVDEHFQPIRDKQRLKEFRQQHNITGRTVLYSGSIFNRRRLPLLMEAFRRLSREHQDLQLLIAGENRTYPYVDLVALAQKLGISQNVRFFGFVDEDSLLLLYNVADIFAYLSDYEGFGIPLLEALACGTPVISSANSALKEIFSSTAWLIPKNETDEIYYAISQILNNPELSSEIVKKGKQLLQQFSYEKTAREILRHLETLVD